METSNYTELSVTLETCMNYCFLLIVVSKSIFLACACDYIMGKNMRFNFYSGILQYVKNIPLYFSKIPKLYSDITVDQQHFK